MPPKRGVLRRVLSTLTAHRKCRQPDEEGGTTVDPRPDHPIHRVTSCVKTAERIVRQETAPLEQPSLTDRFQYSSISDPGSIAIAGTRASDTSELRAPGNTVNGCYYRSSPIISVAFYDEPAIVLKNRSSCMVSFWVLQECKMMKAAVRERVLREIDGSLNICPFRAGSAVLRTSVSQQKEVVAERQDTYFLTADERVGPEGTTVYFPKGCHDLRVLGYFREGSNQSWTRFKDKVYSISRRKKVFTLEATDERIGRYRTTVEEEEKSYPAE